MGSEPRINGFRPFLAPLGAPENFAPFCYPPASFFFILRAIWIFKMMHFPLYLRIFSYIPKKSWFFAYIPNIGETPPHPKGGFDTNHKITGFLMISSPMPYPTLSLTVCEIVGIWHFSCFQRVGTPMC